MIVEIESLLILPDKKAVKMFTWLVNTILLCRNESELRECIKHIKGIDKYYKYGFGRHHFWVSSKVIPGEHRLFIVRF